MKVILADKIIGKFYEFVDDFDVTLNSKQTTFNQQIYENKSQTSTKPKIKQLLENKFNQRVNICEQDVIPKNIVLPKVKQKSTVELLAEQVK